MELLNPLVEKFNQGVPSFFGGIRTEVGRKISQLALVQACARGEDGAIEALILDFWPFINVFPGHIEAANRHMVRGKYLTPDQKPHRRELWDLVSDLLPGIRQDEEAHRELWIKFAKANRIPMDELERVTPSREMLELIHLTSEKIHPTEKLLQFAAVEMVATALSQTLLASSSFCEKMPDGLGWFRVHAEHHGDDTHETLVIKLALALHPGVTDSTKMNEIVQKTVDTFVHAADACLAGVQEIQHV